jgi:hypothetical protein
MSTESTTLKQADRIAGAKECISAMVKLEESIGHLPAEANDAAVLLNIEASDAATLVAQFGPLTPRQEGAFRAMAEYVHLCLHGGAPNLEHWVPVVAMTPDELAKEIQSFV